MSEAGWPARLKKILFIESRYLIKPRIRSRLKSPQFSNGWLFIKVAFGERPQFCPDSAACALSVSVPVSNTVSVAVSLLVQCSDGVPPRPVCEAGGSDQTRPGGGAWRPGEGSEGPPEHDGSVPASARARHRR